MDIRQLKYFIEIVDSGSLTAASSHLRVAQSALSRHLQSLEQELGKKLLVRQPKGVLPTEVGWQFYNHAKKIVTDLEEIPAKMEQIDHQYEETVRIGAPISIALGLFGEVGQEVKLKFPGMEKLS